MPFWGSSFWGYFCTCDIRCRKFPPQIIWMSCSVKCCFRSWRVNCMSYHDWNNSFHTSLFY